MARTKSPVRQAGPQCNVGPADAPMCAETRPPLTSPFIILYVSKRCGGRNRVKMVNSCGRLGFVGSQRVATGRNESQRVATGVNVLAFTCQVPAAASRNGPQRASTCWFLHVKSQPRPVAAGLHGSQSAGFLPVKSEPRQVATSLRAGFYLRSLSRGESEPGPPYPGLNMTAFVIEPI